MNIKHNSESLVVQNSDTCAILLHLFLSEEPPEWRKDAEKFEIFQDSNKTPTAYCFREYSLHILKNLPLLQPQYIAILKIILQVFCIYSLSMLSSMTSWWLDPPSKKSYQMSANKIHEPRQE
jgi:hypothetical protein